jgi:hypothetical protein
MGEKSKLEQNVLQERVLASFPLNHPQFAQGANRVRGRNSALGAEFSGNELSGYDFGAIRDAHSFHEKAVRIDRIAK